MPVYDVGDPIRLRTRFKNPAGVYTDPTAVTATVRKPDGTSTTYAEPTVVNDTALTGGYYLDLVIDQAGLWVYKFVGTGAVGAQDEEVFRVRPTVFGGAGATWVDPGTVSECCTVTDLSELEVWAQVASDVLHVLSGRQFTTGHAATVRPCHIGPACCGSCTYGCECRAVEIPLGEDVARVTSVLMDGATVDPATYRLDPGGLLVRLATSPAEANEGWVACQRIDLANTQVGTLEVAYVTKFNVPEAGVRAAADLACELAKGCAGLDCALPSRVTSLTSQGVTVQVLDPQQFLDQGKTGLYLPDLFLSSVNPHRLTQRPSVISPDFRPPRWMA